MKKSFFVSSKLAAFAVLLGCLPQAVAQSVPMGTTSNFGVLAGSGITIAGAVNSSTINGDIGTFPTTTITGLGNVVLNGTNHAGNAVTQAAKNDLVIAYNNAAGRAATTVATELGGTIKSAGTYDSASTTFAITGTLTLDGGGDPNAVFVFKMGSTLTTATSSQVSLINGAQANNVFWQVGSSATIGSSSVFKGNVLALSAITLGTSAGVEGRLLARNSFTQLDGSNTITVPFTAQTITFASIATHTACDAPFTFAFPVASSALAVTLGVSGPATVSGNTVTLTGATGTVVLTATQPGNATFAAAPTVTRSFTVTACALTAQTITFPAISSRTACDAPFTFTLPTASSGLPVTIAVTGPGSVAGNTVTLTGATGTVIITASQAGNGTFAAASNVAQSIVVAACAPAPTAQTITFAAIPGHTACDAPFTFVSPTASSGLPVTLAVSGPAAVSGNTVTLTGTVGTVVITASQAGNGTFAAASNVTQSFVVAACAPTPQTIAFAPIPAHTASDAPFTFVLPTSSSGLPVTVAVSGPATVSGNTVTLTGATGTVVLTAAQGGNANFAAAPNVTQSFPVTAGCIPPVITNGSLSAAGVVGTPFSYTITASGSPTIFTAFNLPPGLFLNSQTGVISGTPTEHDEPGAPSPPAAENTPSRARTIGATFVTITAGNGDCVSLPVYLMIVVVPAPVMPVITSPTTVCPGTVGTAFNFAVTSTGAPSSYAATNLPAGLTINPTTGAISGTPAKAGTYPVTISATNSAGTATSVLSLVVAPVSSIINVSARMNVTTGEGTLIVGLVITGTGPKTVLIRGVGPTLSTFGVTGALADPRITVFSGQTQLAANDNWETGTSTAAQIAGASTQVGAFALAAGSRDSALLVTLQPGAYTIQLAGVGSSTGAALVEVYDTQ